jgi:hypothetical protein
MRLALRRTLLICLVLLLPFGPASADEGARKHAIPWPDSFVTRLEAVALLQTLNADLLSHDSATLLDTSETSFGRAVQALNFRRRTLSAKLLWLPLPEGWETDAPMSDRSPAMLGVPHAVLEHRAVLTLPDGTPFSEVVETYTGAISWHSRHRRHLRFGLEMGSRHEVQSSSAHPFRVPE